MRASPAARATPAVRSFGYAEIADGVVYHDRARAETLGNVFPALGVAGPDTGGKCERRIISARNGFFGVPNRLNGKDRPERLFLKQPHRRIDSRDDCRLEKIGTKIGARMATAQHFRAARDSIVDQVAQALHVLPANMTLSGEASIRAWPTSPPPWITLTSSFGNPASEKSFSISAPHCGVKSLVLQTTAFPAATAGIIWLRGIASG